MLKNYFYKNKSIIFFLVSKNCASQKNIVSSSQSIKLNVIFSWIMFTKLLKKLLSYYREISKFYFFIICNFKKKFDFYGNSILYFI